MQEIQKNVVTFLTDYGFRIFGAVIILIVGAFVARALGRRAEQWMVKRQIEPPLRMLGVRLLRLVVFGIAAILAADKLSIPVMPIVTGIGVAGVGIGLAMQGVLSNIVAGLTIIFTKPFKVGQYIEIAGVQGQVLKIELFSTTLTHSDLSHVVIPNRKIVGEILHNYGTIRQLDCSVGVAYDTNIEEALTIIRDILQKNPRVLKDPAPGCGVAGLGDSSVNLAVKPWTTLENYGPAGGEISRAILEAFRARNIDIPFPQREVRLVGQAVPETVPPSPVRGI
jgi:small conductance mechanosensitive channel